MLDIKILVVTHKKYELPNATGYFPIQVGKINSNENLMCLADNNGKNISDKNTSFCELTALYWAWQNHFFDYADYIGLVHYRRYFKGNDIQLKNKKVASINELDHLIKECRMQNAECRMQNAECRMQNAECIVPKKRNYYIETVRNHYKHAHHIKDIEKLEVILEQYYPNYLPAYHSIMNNKKLHLFNMFIMKTDLVEQYCYWLFDILFKLEKEIDISHYDTYQKRVFGFISERLFNVWLLHHKINVKEITVVNMENENILKKGFCFLKRKFIKQ